MTATVVEFTPAHRVDMRQCPICGFLISQQMVDLCIFNAPCGRCNNAKLSQFTIYRPPPGWTM